MVAPISGSAPRIPTSENLMAGLDATNWSSQVKQKFVSDLDAAVAGNDTAQIQKLKDSFEAAAISPSATTQAAQTGTTTGGVAAEGQGIQPTVSKSQNEATLRYTYAPPPEAELHSSYEFTSQEATDALVGEPAISPDPGMPATVDSPVQPMASAQKTDAYDPMNVFTGQVSDMRNSPTQIAARMRQSYEKQGATLPQGQTWDAWQTAKATELSKSFEQAGGVFLADPQLMANEAAKRMKSQGLTLSDGATKELAGRIGAHLDATGGRLRTGGELQEFVQKQVAGVYPDQSQQAMFGFGGSTAAPMIGTLAGTAIGAVAGTFLGGPIGTMIGGYLGGSLGSMVGQLCGSSAMVNPSMAMMPGLAGNPLAMGMGGALATVGMGGFMGGGMSGLERGMAGATGMQNAMLSQEIRLKRIMTQQAQLQGDKDMVRMINSGNVPIEKLIAMWSLKNCDRYDQELRDKMNAAEDARQRAEAEKNSTKAQGNAAGTVSTLAGVAGFMVGGPVGAMVGSTGAGLLQSAITSPGGIMGQDGKPPESAAALQLEVQMSLEEWKRSYELASNMLKSLHDMSMTAINNIRG